MIKKTKPSFVHIHFAVLLELTVNTFQLNFFLIYLCLPHINQINNNSFSIISNLYQFKNFHFVLYNTKMCILPPSISSFIHSLRLIIKLCIFTTPPTRTTRCELYQVNIGCAHSLLIFTHTFDRIHFVSHSIKNGQEISRACLQSIAINTLMRARNTINLHFFPFKYNPTKCTN